MSQFVRRETLTLRTLSRVVYDNPRLWSFSSQSFVASRQSSWYTPRSLFPRSTSASASSHAAYTQIRSKHSNAFARVIVREMKKDNSNEAIEILIDNPQKLNSLDSALIDELTQAFQSIKDNESLRCVILRGNHDPASTKSPSFCAGANVNEMSNIESSEQAKTFIRRVSNLNDAARDCPVPVIAAIHGFCFGAGLELAASCDVRYATSASKFAMPEVPIGIPSVVQARLLVDIVGWANARYLTLFGKTIDASEAFRQGLLNAVFETSEDMEARVQEDIDTLFHCGPTAARVQKKLMRSWEEMGVDEGIEASVKDFAHMWDDGGTEPKKFMQEALDRLKSKKKAK